MDTEKKFYELSENVITTFKEIYEKKAFPINIGFGFYGKAKQKQLIVLKVLSDEDRYLHNKDVLVKVNEDVFDKFDEEAIKILIEQEMDKIFVDGNSGKIKTIKPDLNTFSGIVNKYGIEKVARANSVENLYDQQKKDGALEGSNDFIG